MTIKYHLACGSQYKGGWINVDLNHMIKADIYADIMSVQFWDGIKDGTVDYFYCEHFLEHLTANRGKWFMAQCHKKLKSGGVLRIAMPDLDHLVMGYLNGSWKNDEWVNSPQYPECHNMQTAAEYLNVSMRSWDHKFLYDIDTLDLYLTHSGFDVNDIHICNNSLSSFHDLKNLETRGDSILIVDAVKE